MSYEDALARLKEISKHWPTRADRTDKRASGSFVSAYRGAFSKIHHADEGDDQPHTVKISESPPTRTDKTDESPSTTEPTAPCPCGSGVYHQTEPSRQWLCSACHPRTGTPVAVLAIPGGSLRGERQDVAAVLDAAAEGLPTTASDLMLAFDTGDLADIGAGLIGAETARVYALDLIELGLLEPAGQPVDVAATTEDAIEAYQERAAIMEHCGELPRSQAEKLARVAHAAG